MYHIHKRTQNGWEDKYIHADCDADAMMSARRELDETCSMVSIYRHEDEDTCGIKHFVAAYDR